MKLYLASGNAHKVQELQALADASGLAIEVLSAKAAGGMPRVEEDTGTFIGNARKKAQALKTKLPPEAWVLADDSGLCVDELGGNPGVDSAYYAGPQGDSAANLRKLVEVMRAVPGDRRAAHFYCVLVLLGGGEHDRVETIFEGRVDGTLAFEPRGGQGFGYDPLFVPHGGEKTLAELTEAEKNEISHRARAAQKLFAWCREQMDTA
ncbi:MAG TPA: RdgB/HAM1 family non-canonical purine NTP pyrophosphatase [Opitutaceae bacterium]|nr:RdgB/HAM1 family non-canonical purine NTP pyrophosphatase [Opitutaceae bacterium]